MNSDPSYLGPLFCTDKKVTPLHGGQFAAPLYLGSLLCAHKKVAPLRGGHFAADMNSDTMYLGSLFCTHTKRWPRYMGVALLQTWKVTPLHGVTFLHAQKG